MTATQYRSRAAELRKKNPDSRAAALYERLAKLRPESEVDSLTEQYRERLGLDDATTREEARRQAVVTAGGQDQAPETARMAIASAKKRDKFGFHRGLRKIILRPDHDQWNGCYVPDGDRIEFQAKLWRRGDREQVQVVLHEFGHRGQEHGGAELFMRFKQLKLGTLDAFRRIANATHLEDYAVTGKVDDLPAEVWAESYARFCLNLPLPNHLMQFWRRAYDESRAS